MFGKKEDFDKEIQKVEGEAISSIIDNNMTITGDISFKGKTRIDGVINGNITGDHLLLSKDGQVNGEVEVSSFICQGKFTGNLHAKILTAKRGCNINGKIFAVSLTVEPGACLEGEVSVAKKDSSSASNSPDVDKKPVQKNGPASIPESN